jgi:hypothetical protein
MSKRTPINARFVPKSSERLVNEANDDKPPRMSDTVVSRDSFLIAPWTDYQNLKNFGKGKDSWKTIK